MSSNIVPGRPRRQQGYRRANTSLNLNSVGAGLTGGGSDLSTGSRSLYSSSLADKYGAKPSPDTMALLNGGSKWSSSGGGSSSLKDFLLGKPKDPYSDHPRPLPMPGTVSLSSYTNTNSYSPYSKYASGSTTSSSSSRPTAANTLSAAVAAAAAEDMLQQQQQSQVSSNNTIPTSPTNSSISFMDALSEDFKLPEYRQPKYSYLVSKKKPDFFGRIDDYDSYLMPPPTAAPSTSSRYGIEPFSDYSSSSTSRPTVTAKPTEAPALTPATTCSTVTNAHPTTTTMNSYAAEPPASPVSSISKAASPPISNTSLPAAATAYSSAVSAALPSSYPSTGSASLATGSVISPPSTSNALPHSSYTALPPKSTNYRRPSLDQLTSTSDILASRHPPPSASSAYNDIGLAGTGLGVTGGRKSSIHDMKEDLSSSYLPSRSSIAGNYNVRKSKSYSSFDKMRHDRPLYPVSNFTNVFEVAFGL